MFSSLNTCKELASLGIECYVSTTNDNGSEIIPPQEKQFLNLFDNIFVKYYRQNVKEKFSLSMIGGLRKDLRHADVVHVQAIFSVSTPLGLFFANLFSKKTILSPHGCLGEWCMADGNSRMKKPYLNLFIRPFANKITWHATSTQEKNEILALFPSATVAIIPNGIYAEEFAQPNHLPRLEFVRKYTGLELPNAKVVISMARLHKKKGLDILISAFATASLSHPEAVLLIAGEDFGEKKALQKQIQELNLSTKVFLVGQIEGQERIDFFANSDLFALSSHNENFGLVYAEAMAAGTPILASKHTPWQEVEELKIGKWVANTIEDTANGLIELLSSDLDNMGKAARQFVITNYTWKSIGIQFKSLFDSLLVK